MVLALSVISCTARQPKSTTFSGWPRANSALPPEWLVSVEAVALTFAKGARHCAVIQGADEAAAAHAQEFPVPTGVHGEPNLGLDIRIRGGFQRKGHAAVSRKYWRGGAGR